VRVVLDTNVLVSGLLSPFGTPARVLDLLTSGLLIPLFDDRILQEYTEVLARPRFGFAADDVSTLLTYLRMHGELVVAPPLDVDLPDPADLPFLEVAAAAGARAVVTGNARHFLARRGAHDAEVWSPAELLSHFRAFPTD
jgi:putative PIN family toxin of toxin-antitoxin system